MDTKLELKYPQIRSCRNVRSLLRAASISSRRTMQASGTLPAVCRNGRQVSLLQGSHPTKNSHRAVRHGLKHDTSFQWMKEGWKGISILGAKHSPPSHTIVSLGGFPPLEQFYPLVDLLLFTTNWLHWHLFLLYWSSKLFDIDVEANTSLIFENWGLIDPLGTSLQVLFSDGLRVLLFRL